MSEEIERKPDRAKIEPASDAIAKPSVIKTEEQQALWEQMLQKDDGGSATHIGVSPEVIAEMKRKGLAQQLEIVGLDEADNKPNDRLLAKAPEKANEKPELVALPGVSPDFKRRVEDWWQSVPEHTRQMATDSGVQVIVTNRANQVMSNADATQARRHREGETYAQQPGFYYQKRNAVVLVEHRDLTPGEKHTREVLKSKGIQGSPEPRTLTDTAWHELGHALDFSALKHLTASKEFDEAFHKGLPRLNDLERQQWHYSVTPDQHGSYQPAKEELFAEIVRITNKPPEKLEEGEKRMLERFKEVVDVMRKHGL